MILSLAKSDMAHLPIPQKLKGRPYRVKVLCFDKGESTLIMDRAYSEAGYLMVLPLLLAASVQAMQRLMSSLGIEGGKEYIVSVSLDDRKGASHEEQLFFNHLSYLFFRIDSKQATSMRAAIASIKKQMFDQVKAGMPNHINEASMLMRVLPLEALKVVMRLPMVGKMGSFCFSHVGEPLKPLDRFMEAKVVNLIHMPRVPIPPGMGIFFTQFNGRLNLSFSYVDGMLSDLQVNAFVDLLREILIGRSVEMRG